MSGYDTHNFKIVLPFLSVSRGAFGTVFKDIVLAPGYNGSVSVLFGSFSLPSTVTVTSLVKFKGMVGLDTAKRSVSVLKDINKDGFDDLIIGDPYIARCYVMFGTVDGFVHMTSGFTIFGEHESDLTGWSVSEAGDVNNDSIHDIIVGAPFALGKGSFYVIYGRKSNHFDVYLNNLTTSQGFVVYGAQKSDCLGLSVSSAGDVNKDGFDDIVVGAALTLQYYSGAAYVVYGGSSLVSYSSIATLTINASFKLSGASYMYAGYSVSGAGDVNRDGFADIVVGTNPTRNSVVISTYIVYGAAAGANLVLASLTRSQGVQLTGGGILVSASGDVNKDEYDDVVIGFSAESEVGVIVFSNASHFAIETSRPTTLPSIVPSKIPTQLPTTRAPVVPSVRPSYTPTVEPSTEPSSPTETPTQGVTEPTSWPTSLPTFPTVEPSQSPSESPTDPPTQEPSEMPSLYPTVEPSESPSLWPSDAPSEMPSLVSTILPTTETPTTESKSRAPFSVPTALPSAETTSSDLYSTVHIHQPGTVTNQSESHRHYVLNTTGSVTIVNYNGNNVFTIYPLGELDVTVVHFDNTSDLVDLTQYPSITEFSQIVITEGSAIIAVSKLQSIHIMNLHPADLSAANFLLNKDETIPDKKLQFIRTAAPVVGVIVGVFTLAAIVWYVRGYVDEQKREAVPEFEDFQMWSIEKSKDGFDIESNVKETAQGVLTEEERQQIDQAILASKMSVDAVYLNSLQQIEQEFRVVVPETSCSAEVPPTLELAHLSMASEESSGDLNSITDSSEAEEASAVRKMDSESDSTVMSEYNSVSTEVKSVSFEGDSSSDGDDESSLDEEIRNMMRGILQETGDTSSDSS